MRAETSLEAFRSLAPLQLQRKEQVVMKWFWDHPATEITREKLAGLLGWKEAAVCGRVNSLITKHCLEEVEGGKTSSGRSAKLLRLPAAGSPQGALFYE